MLQTIQIGYGLPLTYRVDPTATFQSGQIAQLKVIGNDIVAGVSDGTAPLGIIDDVRTVAFSQVSYDEVVIIPCNGRTMDGYNYFTEKDSKQELRNPNIISSSFFSEYEGLILNPLNGVLTLPAGSRLNFDNDGDGAFDSVKTIVNYIYEITNIPGEDTTVGSSRVTIWFQRGIFATDQFDTYAKYPVNATLFVNQNGKLTTSQPFETSPGVAMVTGPPTAMDNTLEFVWY